MKVQVLDKTGKKVKDITLEKSLFGIEPSLELVKQYIRTYTMNKRQGTSSAKTRAEVSGGGRKPWRQKGTGRARVGSNRSPIWRHGGITHGPKPKSWNLKMPKKMKKKAFLSALTLKAQNNEILILENFDIRKPNTKKFEELLNNLKSKKRNVLFVCDTADKNIIKSANNVQSVEVTFVDEMNTYDLVKSHEVIFLEKALDKLKERFTNETK